MPARILDGRALARDLCGELQERASALVERGVQPRLCVVMVGEDEASAAYVRGIRSLAAKIGVAVEVDVLACTVSDASVRETLVRHGKDTNVHGIILQQPLPAHLSMRSIAPAMPEEKDVDGASPINAGRLAAATGARFAPATPEAVMALLAQSRAWPLAGRDVVVIGRSSVIGMPVTLLLVACHATVTVTHRRTHDLRAHVARAEVVVAAASRPRLVEGAWLRPGAVVIDVGTNVVDGVLVGDVDFASAMEVAGELTPVPGGVGPVTNAVLMRHVVEAAEARVNSR